MVYKKLINFIKIAKKYSEKYLHIKAKNWDIAVFKIDAAKSVLKFHMKELLGLSDIHN